MKYMVTKTVEKNAAWVYLNLLEYGVSMLNTYHTKHRNKFRE